MHLDSEGAVAPSARPPAIDIDLRDFEVFSGETAAAHPCSKLRGIVVITKITLDGFLRYYIGEPFFAGEPSSRHKKTL